MENSERILEILKTSIRRWIEDTDDDKKIDEKQLYKELLDYIEYLEFTYKGGEEK